MTRKHFRLMAATIAEMKDKTERKNAAEALAVMCAKANPRFDRNKFLSACGV